MRRRPRDDVREMEIQQHPSPLRSLPFKARSLPSKAVAAHLLPPWNYEHRERDQLREIEMAELNWRFGGARAAGLPLSRFDAALRSSPGDLSLHHKVWQMLVATRRRDDAIQSYHAACDRAQCDVTSAAYHACLRSSAAFRPLIPLWLAPSNVHAQLSGAATAPLGIASNASMSSASVASIGAFVKVAHRLRHIIELPQPHENPPAGVLPPERVDPGQRTRQYFGFNPAIVHLPRIPAEAHSDLRGPQATVGTGDGAGPRRSDPPSSPSPSPPVRYAVFFRYSNVRSIWTSTLPAAWQWDEPLWQENLDEGWGTATSAAAVPDVEGDGRRRNVALESATNSRSSTPTPIFDHIHSSSTLDDSTRRLESLVEQAEMKAKGVTAEERWGELRRMVQAAQEGKDNANQGEVEGANVSMAGDASRELATSDLAVPGSPVSAKPSQATAEEEEKGKEKEEEEEEEEEEEGIEIFDIMQTADGGEIPVPVSSVESRSYDFKPGGHIAHGGFSAVGYMIIERAPSGEIRLVGSTNTHGRIGSTVHWLHLSPPFPPCDQECGNELSLLEGLFAWAPTLSPAACKTASESPNGVMVLLTALAVAGFAQLHLGLRRTRARGRLAWLPLLRGLLLLTATLPVRVCRSNGSIDRCIAARRRKSAARQATAVKLNASGVELLNATNNTNGPLGRVALGDARDDWRSVSMNSSSDSDESSGGRWIEYDGYEDSRAIFARGAVHLLASHEDCEGNRRLCLVRLSGDAVSGGLRQEATWVLTVDDEPDFELNDNEKNWSPFLVNNTLFLTYSIQPHVVLRCAWTGGSCRRVHNTSSDFLASAHDALGQGLRGGTAYTTVDLPDGSRALLAAMHIKDTSHAPALYTTAFYLLDPWPPFRVRSVSPKLCLSESSVELATSARCALQYVVGVAVEPRSNLLLLSFGEFDRRMKLASLPLDRVLAFARTHEIAASGDVSISECTDGDAASS